LDNREIKKKTSIVKFRKFRVNYITVSCIVRPMIKFNRAFALLSFTL